MQVDHSPVTIKDKQFEIYISAEEISHCISSLAHQLDDQYLNKDPLVLGILNGSFMFVSDLVKRLDMDPEISFIKLASYDGTQSTGKVNELIGIKEDLRGRHVIVMEDIVDTGNTLEKIMHVLESHQPASLEICTLLYKPEAYKKSFPVKFIGKEIPNKFVVGYGLDYDGYGRTLEHIYQII